jgi:hypothetical protein
LPCIAVCSCQRTDRVTRATQATTVDQVLETHRDMLDSCLKECMLSNAKLLAVRPVPRGVAVERHRI